MPNEKRPVSPVDAMKRVPAVPCPLCPHSSHNGRICTGNDGKQRCGCPITRTEVR